MLLPLLGFSGAWIATDAARELCADIQAAAIRAGLTRKALAAGMDLTEQQLSDQLNLRHPLNIYRLADLPIDFWRAFVVLRAQRVALQVIEGARIQELIRAIDTLQVRMLKADLRRSGAEKRQVG